MATTLRLRDNLGRRLLNATPGTTDPAKDTIGRNILASNLDYMGRGLIATLRANTTAYTLGSYVEFVSQKLYLCTTAGTSAAAPPSETGIDYNETITDGTAVWTRVF